MHIRERTTSSVSGLIYSLALSIHHSWFTFRSRRHRSPKAQFSFKTTWICFHESDGAISCLTMCVRASEWRLFSLSLRRFSACQLLSAFMDDSVACGRCTSLHCDKREFQFSFLDLRARNYLWAKRKNADAEMDSLYHFIAASSGRQAGIKKSHNIKFHFIDAS